MKLLPIFIALSLIFAPLQVVKAAEFNPNFIISDADLENYLTMDEASIQQFLNEKSGVLKSTSYLDTDGTIKTAAQIIARAARENRINPRFLLVMLQKEQSLITDSTPSERQLDWATGYAVCDNCLLSDPKVAKNRGFANQVHSAAALMRYYQENMHTASWIKRKGVTYTISKTSVTPLSNATAFLYTYTPHLHGNENFYKIWNSWFKSQQFPDGVIVQVPGNPDVYLIENGKKRRATGVDIVRTYYGDQTILTVRQVDIDEIPSGENIRFHNYALLRADNGVTYLNVDQILHPFISEDALKKLGFNPDEIINVKQQDVAPYEKGTFLTAKSVYPTGALLKGRTSGKIFYVRNGVKHELKDPALLSTNFSEQKPALFKDTGFESFETGTEITVQNGSLIVGKKDTTIYLVSNGSLRPFTDSKQVAALGFKTEDIVTMTDAYIATLPKGDAMSTK